MKKNFIILFFLFLGHQSISQNIEFEHFAPVTVKNGSSVLKNPFAGGINNPQFSSIDLNFDGKKDLAVFDREGNKVSCFINEGTPGNISYRYDPSYTAKFPELTDWMLLVDYNGDGKEDIFSAIPGGVKIYKNVSNPTDGIKFELFKADVQADYSSFVTRLYVSQVDIPAILDVDDDGDIDILTFLPGVDTAGDAVYWFKNIGLEKYNNKDSVEYVVFKSCWGRFRESYTSCQIYLEYAGPPCNTGHRGIDNMTLQEFEELKAKREQQRASSSGLHAGSTLLITDLNGDNKKDALIGDIGCDNMYALINTNTNEEPIMTQFIRYFPPQDPILIQTFPAAYHVDVNNDGLNDILAVASTSTNSDNTQNIWLYLNKGTSSTPDYQYETNEFLESGMIDVGEGAFPHLFDYDGDGLLDILIGTNGYFQSTSVYKTGLTLYRNTGTATAPAFELVTRDFGGLSALNIIGMTPTTADLDNDGDLDMICGANDGMLHYFRNIAGPGNPVNFQFDPTIFDETFDVGSFSTACLFDYNGDQKPDLIVGERFSNINFFAGVNHAPSFVMITDSLGKLNLRTEFGYPSGYSSISVNSFKGPGKPKSLVVSNANGKVYFYDIMSTSPSDPLLLTDSLDLGQGTFSGKNGGFGITSGDLDGDGLPDLLAGTPAGGLVLYRNKTQVQVGIPAEKLASVFTVYPNPANDKLYIRNTSSTVIHSAEVIDLLGVRKAVYSKDELASGLPVEQLAQGSYLLRIITDQQQVITKKFMLIR